MTYSDDRLEVAYGAKSAQYFSGVRTDFLALLPDNPVARILEVGCGFGETGERALAEGKCGDYVGIEISQSAGAEARLRISSVLIGNVETIALPWAERTFDALIMSEVLEHLVDPWAALQRLAPLLRDGGLVMASSPNISQYRVVRSLVIGRWELTDSGVMDRTHLRWFTPDSYREMFEAAGFVVDHLGPIVPFSAKARLIDWCTLGRFRHLFIRQIRLIGHRR